MDVKRPAARPLQPFKEMLNQQWNIFCPLTQWGKLNLDNPQPIIKVFAKFALLHQIGKLAIAGGDDSQIDLDNLVASDAPHFLLFDGPQQFDLKRRAGFRNFVQKNGSTAGFFKDAALVFDGAGK